MIWRMPFGPLALTWPVTFGFDGVVDHFTLIGDEAEQLRNKAGATQLGFAVLLKFLLWRGRFPQGGTIMPGPPGECWVVRLFFAGVSLRAGREWGGGDTRPWAGLSGRRRRGPGYGDTDH